MNIGILSKWWFYRPSKGKNFIFYSKSTSSITKKFIQQQESGSKLTDITEAKAIFRQKKIEVFRSLFVLFC